MNRALTTMGFLALTITSPLLSGCYSSGMPDLGEPRHTSHLWETDTEATLALIAEQYPEDAAAIEGVDFHELDGVYDIRLELISDKAYVLHIHAYDDVAESRGTWRHIATSSGTQVRLSPAGSSDQLDLSALRSWIIHIDPSGRRARISSFEEVDTILTRVD